MAEEQQKSSSDPWIPPDLATIIVPMLAGLAGLYVICGISWTKATGDRSLFYCALWLGGIGSLALFLARWPLYRQGRFFSMGPRPLTGWHRKLYYLAYAMIVPSLVLLGLLLLNLR